MAAYVPVSMADRMSRLIQLGKIYLIKNFEVKEYLEKDKFRVVNNDKQIIFTVDTRIKEIGESEVFILQNNFDLYEFADLKQMSTQVQNLLGTIYKFVLHTNVNCILIQQLS